MVNQKVIEKELGLLLSQTSNIDNIRDAMKWCRTLSNVANQRSKSEDNDKLSELVLNALLDVTNTLLDLLHEDEETESFYGNNVFEILTKVLTVINTYQKKSDSNKPVFELSADQKLALSVVKDRLSSSQHDNVKNQSL